MTDADRQLRTTLDSTALVTDHVVAQLCGVRRSTVAKWRERQVGPPWIISGPRAVRYRIADVQEYLLRRRVDPAA